MGPRTEPSVPIHLVEDHPPANGLRAGANFPSCVGLGGPGEESIRALAEDIRKRKLQNPIQVTPNMVTPDGERRQRALMMLNIEETYVHVVHGLDTPESVEDYVWDSYGSGRDAALDERVKLYQLAQRVLHRRHGRPNGRPRKSSSNDELFWEPKQVKAEAAKKAGFGSDVVADRAVSEGPSVVLADAVALPFTPPGLPKACFGLEAVV